MDRRRGKILPAVLAAVEIIGAKPGLAASKEVPAAAQVRVEQKGKDKQATFLHKGLESVHQMVMNGKEEDAKRLAVSLGEQLNNVSDLGPYVNDISELANRLREFGEQEQERAVYRFAYSRLNKEEQWKEKFQFGEEVARLYLLAEDKNAARRQYKEMYDLYQELKAHNRPTQDAHLRTIIDKDGDQVEIEPYQDWRTFQKYMDYQLNENSR